VIRTFKKEDTPAVLELLRLNSPKYFDYSEEKDFIDFLERERELYFVYELEGKIVGCGGANFWENGTVARVSWGMIHPEYQGYGIGKKLTLHRIEAIKAYPSVKTIIVRTSQKVFPFYEKLGFELFNTEKDYWAEGLDLVELKMNV
jgi:ribosomal protein S18 acetylase RimI-like enzyme